MLVEYRDRTPFDLGWKPPTHYDPDKLLYDQLAYADYRAFEGIDFRSERYSFWNDEDRFERVRSQMGDLGSLLNALGAHTILSLGSGRPIWEVLISAQAPQLKLLASDINIPHNVSEDLRRGQQHGFPAAANIGYFSLDIRDTSAASRIMRDHAVDTLFICSCFFVTSDSVWQQFLAAASRCNVRNVVLLHSEAISPLNLVRYRLFGANREGVLMGYLRSTSAVIDLFSRTGYRHRASYVPAQSCSLARRVLARLGIHYSLRGYVFSLQPLDSQVPILLKAAMTCRIAGR